MITINQLQQFVSIINPNVKVKIGNYFPFAAYVNYKEGDTIYIDWRWLKYKLNNTNPKNKMCVNDEHRLIIIGGLLLHELGHISKKHYEKTVQGAKEELEAQVWAIRKAKRLGLTPIYEELKAEFEQEWPRQKWKSPFRIYRMARKEFVTKKMKYKR